jgi:hypothetical protein
LFVRFQSLTCVDRHGEEWLVGYGLVYLSLPSSLGDLNKINSNFKLFQIINHF